MERGTGGALLAGLNKAGLLIPPHITVAGDTLEFKAAEP